MNNIKLLQRKNHIFLVPGSHTLPKIDWSSTGDLIKRAYWTGILAGLNAVASLRGEHAVSDPQCTAMDIGWRLNCPGFSGQQKAALVGLHGCRSSSEVREEQRRAVIAFGLSC